MKTSSIFTRRSMGLDRKVWLVMSIVIILCVGLFSYRLIDKNADKPCLPVTVMINGVINNRSLTFNMGEMLIFKATTAPGDEITWDFGDNTKIQEGFTTSHQFSKAGIYDIRVLVNKKCDNPAKVNIIKPAPIIRDTAGNITENIIGPEVASTGETLKYTTPLQATSIEWNIANNDNYLTRTTRDATFKFGLAGTYVIQLTLDKDRQKRYTKSVVITDAGGGVTEPEDKPKPKNLLPQQYTIVIPPKKEEPAKQQEPTETKPVVEQPKKPEEPKVTRQLISNKLLQIMLQEVVKGTKSVDDFNTYFCNGGNTKVNDKGNITTFSAFCAAIKGKKITIESVEQGKDNDCIITLTVQYKKKGWLF